MGNWDIRTYGSGTHIVAPTDRRGSHLYVYAAPGRTRYETCEDLCSWLNGEAPRPSWAGDLIRATEETAHHPGVNEHGAVLSIQATGPSIESEPGRGDWTPDPAFKDERARLMDRLCGVGQETTHKD